MLSESHISPVSLSLSLSCLLSPSVTPYLYPHLHHHCACPWAVTVIVSASGAVTRATNSIEYCTAYCAFPLHKIKAQFPLPPPPHNLSPLCLFSSFTCRRRGQGGTTICLWHSNLLSLARDRGASARLNIPLTICCVHLHCTYKLTMAITVVYTSLVYTELQWNI